MDQHSQSDSSNDTIPPPKRPLTFARALRGSVKRNFSLIIFLAAVVATVVLRGNYRESLMNAFVWGFIVFVISITLVPAIRKQNEEHRLKRDSDKKP
jgi:hypothetical protein